MKLNYEELEAKLAALAEENAGLKAAIDATIGWQQSTDPKNVESVRMLVDVKTPATDAFLSEVRAQGVESAGEYLKQYAQGLHEEARLVLQDAGELCNGFAAQLRKGVQS
ncbi:hypothetical protein BOB30_000501 [Enterobacter hormaechei]|uniref:hypothetical protein n=1 Tax=unclassified Enterobacter cloacae complex TaxID=2757714 RepID=UPI000CDDB767|nr:MULTISPECIES: hypothetical protein [unclassified Enterobacter cloacae complex]EHF4923185.1 hypothetical protein [Enterobacter hormaechei]POV17017.1 hypothetical protein C3371_01155 [Enterobacter cloacae complex sp. ECNIH13]POV69325.1 hypothetical protein C3390_01155 [Enterobacter cloacae complex sp. ECNIH15]HCJ6259504.1 hypothetical protein [Enterobacter hormaechei subsp. xiangfangensis]